MRANWYTKRLIPSALCVSVNLMGVKGETCVYVVRLLRSISSHFEDEVGVGLNDASLPPHRSISIRVVHHHPSTATNTHTAQT